MVTTIWNEKGSNRSASVVGRKSVAHFAGATRVSLRRLTPVDAGFPLPRVAPPGAGLRAGDGVARGGGAPGDPGGPWYRR
jgi:hypothetical protein